MLLFFLLLFFIAYHADLEQELRSEEDVEEPEENQGRQSYKKNTTIFFFVCYIKFCDLSDFAHIIRTVVMQLFY
jgi:hypothetical protein